MQENLKDILTNLSTEVDQETLLLYLQGKLSAEQQHEVEKKMKDFKTLRTNSVCNCWLIN
jgi:hypothetical protein